MSEIERICRELCEEHGEDPDRRIQEFGQTSHHYPAWEAYRGDAKKIIERKAAHAARDGHGREAQADRVVST